MLALFAVIIVRLQDSQITWNGSQCAIPPGIYLTPYQLADALNDAIGEAVFEIAVSGAEARCNIVQSDPWTLDMPVTLRAYLGLTPGFEGGTGYTASLPLSSCLEISHVQRRFGLMPKTQSAGNFRTCGQQMTGAARLSDTVTLVFDESLAGRFLRFSDLVAGGGVYLDGQPYVLTDDALTPVRRNGMLEVEMNLVPLEVV